MSSTKKWRRSTTTTTTTSTFKTYTTSNTSEPIKSKWTKKRTEHTSNITTEFSSNSRNTIYDNLPIKTRTWKNKLSCNSNDNQSIFSPRKRVSNLNADVPATNTIQSKWTKARIKKDDPFSISRNQKPPTEPMKKSFNKKIVIIEHETIAQRKAKEKAVYDSFIKDSYVLKIQHGDKQILNNSTTITDCWDSLDDLYGADLKVPHKSDFDKWYDEFRSVIENHFPSKKRLIKSNPILMPWDGNHMCGHEQDWYIYNQLASFSMVNHDKIQVAMNYYKISKLDLDNLNTISIHKKELGTLMDPNTHASDCGYSKMRMVDFNYEYNLNNLLEVDPKILRKEFLKLRKTHNANQRIALKLQNKHTVQQAELNKYLNRYKVEFLLERLIYFDQFLMNGTLNFINNYTPTI